MKAFRPVIGGLILLGLTVTPGSASPFAYIGNSGSTIAVLDTATNTQVATVEVGMGLSGVAVHPAGTFVYVMNGGSHTTSVIDTASNEVVATLPWGTGPTAFGQFVGPLSAGASLTLNAPSFDPGDVLALKATTYPGDRAQHVDAYVELRTPSGIRLFLPSPRRGRRTSSGLPPRPRSPSIRSSGNTSSVGPAPEEGKQ
jgi:YVTN family beta-propeller protein